MIIAHLGYSQILMHEPNEDKTTFIIDLGTYCYKVMPFGIKNIEATFQCLVDQVFLHQIGRNIFTYVDDILVKSSNIDKHPEDLEETFDAIKQYGMKLNSAKCSFGIKEDKFLGFYVGKQEIRSNSKNIKVVLDMTPPHTIREAQCLNEFIHTLSCFISKTTDKCKLFFQLLKITTKRKVA